MSANVVVVAKPSYVFARKGRTNIIRAKAMIPMLKKTGLVSVNKALMNVPTNSRISMKTKKPSHIVLYLPEALSKLSLNSVGMPSIS